MSVSFTRVVSCLLLVVLVGSAALADDTVDLPRTSAAIVVDGVMDEAAWSDALKIRLDIETDPGENTPAEIETVAYLIEDGESIYVGFDASESDTDSIRAYVRDRDTAWDDDLVGISFDTYNDGLRAYDFWVNALGVQMDAIYDDTVSDNDNDDSWDGIWDSAGRINDDGYIVEMRIPLDQLRFPLQDGAADLGLQAVARASAQQRDLDLERRGRSRPQLCSVPICAAAGTGRVKAGQRL